MFQQLPFSCNLVERHEPEREKSPREGVAARDADAQLRCLDPCRFCHSRARIGCEVSASFWAFWS